MVDGHIDNMTPQEAIKNIDNVLSVGCHYDETLDCQLTSYDIDWLEESKKALEKQMPKKVVKHNGSELYHCPNCDTYFLGNGFKHCTDCGQALDWSDTE